MQMTKIALLSHDGERIIGEPEILWPPPGGEPDIISIAGDSFVKADIQRECPTYRLASRFGITGFDLTWT